MMYSHSLYINLVGKKKTGVRFMTRKSNQSEEYREKRRAKRAFNRRNKRLKEREIKEAAFEYQTDRYKRKIQRHILYCKIAIALCHCLPLIIYKAIYILFF